MAIQFKLATPTTKTKSPQSRKVNKVNKVNKVKEDTRTSYQKLINNQVALRRNNYKGIKEEDYYGPFLSCRGLLLISLCKNCIREKKVHTEEWKNLVDFCNNYQHYAPKIKVGIKLKAKTIANFDDWMMDKQIPIPIKGTGFWWKFWERFMKL